MKPDYSKHKNILLQILKDIYSDTSIAPYLGFKGGTAALLFYGLDRDSVDLDFDMLSEGKEGDIFKKIQKIAAKYGKIVDSANKKFNLLNVISYAPKAPNIKIEINKRQFDSKYEVKNLLGIPMLVMTQEDMCAHKLMAMDERIGKTSRDIYDVWFFLDHLWSINKDIVEQRSGKPFSEAMKNMVEKLEKMDNKHVLDGLGGFLTESQKDWARAKLKSETIFSLKARIASEK